MCRSTTNFHVNDLATLKSLRFLSFSLHLHFPLQPLAKKTHLNKSLCVLPSSNDLYIFVFDSVSVATRGTTSQENHLSSGGQFFFLSTLLKLMNCQQHMITKKSFVQAAGSICFKFSKPLFYRIIFLTVD